MHNFRNLDIWKDSMELTTKIYKLTTVFPSDERFNLTSQIRRCAVSIPSNIAEGAGRNTNADFNQFLGIATASSYELETQLLIAQRLGFIEIVPLEEVITELHSIQKRIYNFKQSIMRKQ
ncbi:MAG: four helix bundle protein [Saprospiraceae bacterium]|nr:four helix bundle protein [Saprospiraceae bacterium]